jgi:hypothetical protein
MRAFKLIMGTILCIVGIYLVFLEVGMVISEPHADKNGGWVIAAVFIGIGVLIFLGGILLCKTR